MTKFTAIGKDPSLRVNPAFAEALAAIAIGAGAKSARRQLLPTTTRARASDGGPFFPIKLGFIQVVSCIFNPVTHAESKHVDPVGNGSVSTLAAGTPDRKSVV